MLSSVTFGNTRKDVCIYFISVTKITNTEIDILYSFMVLCDEVGAICGKESEIGKIKYYNIQTGRELHCLTS